MWPLQGHSCLLLMALCLQIYGAELLNLTRSVAYLSSTEDLQAYGASGAAVGESHQRCWTRCPLTLTVSQSGCADTLQLHNHYVSAALYPDADANAAQAH